MKGNEETATLAFPEPGSPQPPPGAVPADSSAVLATFSPGEMVAQRFRIVRFLGQGGMGQVFEAEDLELGSPVALKVIRPEIAGQADAIARFKREVQLARQVTHPNVCRIFDLFHHLTPSRDWGTSRKPLLLLTMEMLRGETLARHLDRSGALAPDQALPLIAEMAAALDAAHRQGIVHRDFKSGNVLLVDSGNGRRVVVTDFGLARAAGEPTGELGPESEPPDLRSHSATIGGTPAYIAPELVAGREATPAADVYSLGVVIYEMLTGILPFSGDTPEETARLRLSADPLPPRRHRPDLDPTWEAAILKCLRRRPEERFARAGEAAELLAGAARDKRRRRRRRGLAWLAAAGLTLIAGLGLLYPRLESFLPVRQARPAVALLGFKDLSGHPETAWISAALTEMLASELAAGERVRIIPRENVGRMRRELDLAEVETLGAATLGRVHQYLATDFVIVGSYLDLGPESDHRIRLDVSLQDAVAGDTLVQLVDQGEFLELVSRLGNRLRRQLGLTPPAPNEVAAARATLPAGPEAARLYAQARAKIERLEHKEAKELLERVVALDPESATAHAALASCWSAMGHSRQAEAIAQRAFELAAGLPQRQRLLIEGRYREAARDWPRARQVYQALWTFYPDDREYALRLAEMETIGGQPLAALATLDQLRRRTAGNGAGDWRLDMLEGAAARERGDLQRQLRAAARVLEAGRALGAELLVAKARMLEAGALGGLGRSDEAIRAVAEARRIYAARDDRLHLAWALLHQLDSTRSAEDVRRDYEEALATFRELGVRGGEARTLVELAQLAGTAGGDRSRAEELLATARTLAREIGNWQTEAEAAYRAGYLASVWREPRQARAHYDEAVELAREGGNLQQLAAVLTNSANLHAAFLNLPQAAEGYDEAMGIARETGSRYFFGWILTHSGRLHLRRGEIAVADQRFAEALQVAGEIANRDLLAYVHERFAELHFVRGELDEWRRFAQLAVDEWHEPGRERYYHACKMDLARQTGMLGNLAAAETRLREVPEPYRDGRNLLYLAEVLLEQEKVEEAEEVMASVPSDLTAHLRHLSQRLMARIDAAAGNHRQAQDSLAALIAEADARGAVVLGLENRLALGRVRIAAGEPARAREELEMVIREAEAVGLVELAGRARKAMGGR